MTFFVDVMGFQEGGGRGGDGSDAACGRETLNQHTGSMDQV